MCFSLSELPHIHPASLVDPASHSPALLELVDTELSEPIIYHFLDEVYKTADRARHSRGGFFESTAYYSLFAKLGETALSCAEVSTATVLVALVYLDRIRSRLVIYPEEEDGSLERLLLGALVVADKSTNDADTALGNHHWAGAGPILTAGQIGEFERYLLRLLDWKLDVSEEDLLKHHQKVMKAASLPSTRKPSARRTSICTPRNRRSSVASTISNVPSLVPSSPAPSIGRSSPELPRTPDAQPLWRERKGKFRRFFHLPAKIQRITKAPESLPVSLNRPWRRKGKSKMRGSMENLLRIPHTAWIVPLSPYKFHVRCSSQLRMPFSQCRCFSVSDFKLGRGGAGFVSATEPDSHACAGDLVRGVVVLVRQHAMLGPVLRYALPIRGHHVHCRGLLPVHLLPISPATPPAAFPRSLVASRRCRRGPQPRLLVLQPVAPLVPRLRLASWPSRRACVDEH
uniref:Cyclin N-terminal domain-containing protein n=1 Tax=Mycena chlorophos TaxID=658473 RepID=A0ABQ0M2I1_MYCCL|nr:predicted protein [Mycena chlorophos]